MKQSIEERQSQGPASDYQAAILVAREFLCRWQDTITTTNREDLAQQAVIDAFGSRDTLRDKTRFAALIRTVARRTRAHVLRHRLRLPTRSLDASYSIREQLVGPPESSRYPVRGVMVETDEMLDVLPGILEQMSRLSVSLVLGYYEGFSIFELSQRYELSEVRVKARIHRARKHVKRVIELMLVMESGELREDAVPRDSTGLGIGKQHED